MNNHTSRHAVLDPTRAPARTSTLGPVAPLTELTDRRIALIKNAWPSWHAMLGRLASLVAERAAGVTFEQYMVPNGSAADDSLLTEIATTNSAAIVGLANCGSCTAWSFHDAMQLQAQGVPVVLVATKEFAELTDALAKSHGSAMPRVILPLNPETVDLDIALGMVDDAVDAIVDRLTHGSDVTEVASGATTDNPRLVDLGGMRRSDDADDYVHELFYRRGWTDGLPIRLPTDDRVERQLAGLGAVDPDRPIATMPPRDLSVTNETLAVNAAMAGAAPELMPLLRALVQAVCEPQFNLIGIATTTGPSTPMVVVNGPLGPELDINAGRGALGHGSRANVAIGRTLRLLINNIGGATPGDLSKSIMGQPGRISFCFAEREAESPWQPLHVDRGLLPSSSAVTAVGATGTVNVLTPRQDVDAMLTLLADSLAFMGNPNVVMGRGIASVLITPGHARAMADAGLSKADVATEIWRRSTVPLERFPQAALPDPPYELIERDGLVYAVKDPAHVFIVVVGGPEPTHATLVPSHPSSIPVSRSVDDVTR